MIVFLTILVFFLLFIFLVFLKDVLTFINARSSHLRDFTHKNGGFFTLVFLFIFFIEQLFLMLATYYYFEISSDAQLLIGIFGLIVLSTAALEKFILEKKYQYLSKEVNAVTYETQRMINVMKAACKDLYQENLNLKEQLKKKR